jgi:hypothetical protein
MDVSHQQQQQHRVPLKHCVQQNIQQNISRRQLLGVGKTLVNLLSTCQSHGCLPIYPHWANWRALCARGGENNLQMRSTDLTWSSQTCHYSTVQQWTLLAASTAIVAVLQPNEKPILNNSIRRRSRGFKVLKNAGWWSMHQILRGVWMCGQQDTNRSAFSISRAAEIPLVTSAQTWRERAVMWIASRLLLLWPHTFPTNKRPSVARCHQTCFSTPWCPGEKNCAL